MASAHNYLNENSNEVNKRVVAFFPDRNDAYQALSELKDAGFDIGTIGLALGGARYDVRTLFDIHRQPRYVFLAEGERFLFRTE